MSHPPSPVAAIADDALLEWADCITSKLAKGLDRGELGKLSGRGLALMSSSHVYLGKAACLILSYKAD